MPWSPSGQGAAVKVLGVLDGRDMPGETLRAWATSADVVVAADGAADRLLEVGVSPTIVVGDMDGLRSDGDFQVWKDPDPSRTDCDKLLAWVRGAGYPAITLTSVEGDQLDHMLATLSSCVAHGTTVRLALRQGIGWVFQGDIEVEAELGARVSLIPLTLCRAVQLHGARWPLAGDDLAVGGLVSISNVAIAREIRASMGAGWAFLFVGRSPEEAPVW